MSFSVIKNIKLKAQLFFRFKQLFYLFTSVQFFSFLLFNSMILAFIKGGRGWDISCIHAAKCNRWHISHTWRSEAFLLWVFFVIMLSNFHDILLLVSVEWEKRAIGVTKVKNPGSNCSDENYKRMYKIKNHRSIK
jgi:hypothetical protein